jgi:hypothetical protein
MLRVIFSWCVGLSVLAPGIRINKKPPIHQKRRFLVEPWSFVVRVI